MINFYDEKTVLVYEGRAVGFGCLDFSKVCKILTDKLWISRQRGGLKTG